MTSEEIQDAMRDINMVEGELVPCPFCKCKEVSLSWSTNIDKEIKHIFGECEDCAAMGPNIDIEHFGDAESFAIAGQKAWNKCG